MAEPSVGVIGASSFVGSSILRQLTSDRCNITAFTRRGELPATAGVIWKQLAPTWTTQPSAPVIEQWICVAPLAALPAHFTMLEAYGVRKLVAVSSTSRFTKQGSSSAEEQVLAKSLAQAEARIETWARGCGVEWVILRPTLIYGNGRDRNLTEIARFVRRFGFFPVFGKARGLRQPIHSEDVASACLSAMRSNHAVNRAYNISGATILSYRDMVARIFEALGRTPRMLGVPLWAFRLAVVVLRLLPRYHKWTPAMAERMNLDMAFDHADAARDFGFSPRPFTLNEADLPE